MIVELIGYLWRVSYSFIEDLVQFMSFPSFLVMLLVQGHSKGTSSVALEVLTINCQIYFINLLLFNCLTLDIKLFIFKLFDVKFLFSENHAFCKQKKTTVYGVMDARP